MSKPIFWEKKENVIKLLSAELVHTVSDDFSSLLFTKLPVFIANKQPLNNISDIWYYSFAILNYC